MRKPTFVISMLLVSVSAPVISSETITYNDGVKSSLTKVVRTGSVHSNVQPQYTHDKANNRKNVTATGSTNPPP